MKKYLNNKYNELDIVKLLKSRALDFRLNKILCTSSGKGKIKN